MISFFRKFRRKLAFDKKLGRYTRYAIGEVLLIMLGIFMALELQNWNENRKKEVQFKNSVERIYNQITDDSWYFGYAIRGIESNIQAVDTLLEYREGKDLNKLSGLLWTVPQNYKKYRPKTSSLFEKMTYNLNKPEQVRLADQLADYLDLIDSKFVDWYDFPTALAEFLIDKNIPFPKFDYADIDAGIVSDSTFYSSKDFENISRVLQDEGYIARLKSHRSYLSFNYLDFKSLEEEAISMLSRIKKYYPEVKLLYEDVGIIGTSINGYNDVGASSTPMNLIDEDESIWEIELYLKEGTVKFRCRDSWAINWGGNDFPKGTPLLDGPNIPVNEAGNYKVTLNLTENTYEFIGQDE